MFLAPLFDLKFLVWALRQMAQELQIGGAGPRLRFVSRAESPLNGRICLKR
jgi:hypothetical protein